MSIQSIYTKKGSIESPFLSAICEELEGQDIDLDELFSEMLAFIDDMVAPKARRIYDPSDGVQVLEILSNAATCLGNACRQDVETNAANVLPADNIFTPLTLDGSAFINEKELQNSV